jgi:hypothetical protein
LPQNLIFSKKVIFWGDKVHHKTAYTMFLFFIIILLVTINSASLTPKMGSLSVSAITTSSAVHAYLDENCEETVTSLDWGTLSPTQTKTIQLFLRNEGKQAVTLDLTTTDWSPVAAEQYLPLSWNYTGFTLYQNQVEAITMELFVSSQVTEIENFSFDIIINCNDCVDGLGKVACEKVVTAPANTAYFIYSDPSLQSMAEATYDGTSGEILRSLCLNPQNYGFNTNPNWVLPSGEINTTTIHNSTILLFGGRVANNVVNYYEAVKKLVPLTFTTSNNMLFFEDQNGTTLAEFSLDVIDSSNYCEDMFAVMVFYDKEHNNTFLVMYGIGWKGTWASGIYFKEVISTNLDTYTSGYYLFNWLDNNHDGIPQNHEICQKIFDQQN